MRENLRQVLPHADVTRNGVISSRVRSVNARGVDGEGSLITYHLLPSQSATLTALPKGEPHYIVPQSYDGCSPTTELLVSITKFGCSKFYLTNDQS